MCHFMQEVKGWVQFWCTRLVALVPTVLIAVLSDASNSFDRINGLLNVVQSVLLPFALVPVSGWHRCACNLGLRLLRYHCLEEAGSWGGSFLKAVMCRSVMCRSVRACVRACLLACSLACLPACLLACLRA